MVLSATLQGICAIAFLDTRQAQEFILVTVRMREFSHDASRRRLEQEVEPYARDEERWYPMPLFPSRSGYAEMNISAFRAAA